MSDSSEELVMQALEASLIAALPTWHVERSLVDPANETSARITAGVICIVSAGGGNFANWTGREGELGDMEVKLVGFKQVGAKAKPVDCEKAELALLGQLKAWCQQKHAEPIDCVKPGDYRQSQQLSHPLCWLALDLKVSHV